MVQVFDAEPANLLKLPPSLAGLTKMPSCRGMNSSLVSIVMASAEYGLNPSIFLIVDVRPEFCDASTVRRLVSVAIAVSCS